MATSQEAWVPHNMARNQALVVAHLTSRVLVGNASDHLKRLLLGTSVINDSIIGLHIHHLSLPCCIWRGIPSLDKQLVSSLQALLMVNGTARTCAGSSGHTSNSAMACQGGLALRSVVLGPWLARMSYSIFPPVMSKPINCTFLVSVSSAVSGLHRTPTTSMVQPQSTLMAKV